MSNTGDNAGFLSARAARALQPALPYFTAFVKAQERLWCPEDQEGYIVVTVAENKLSHEILRERMLQLDPVPPSVFGYPKGMAGIPELRQALATLLQDTFMSGVSVEPDQLCVLAGAGSVIDILFHCIASAGDGALIPVPYYPAFDNDLQVRAGVQQVPFSLDDSKPSTIAAQLDKAAADSAAAGHPIRALLITNPSNPLGTIYSSEALQAMMDWCLDNKVHLVSDEIYANSVFGAGAGFRSAAHLVSQLEAGGPRAALARQLVHVVWGMSKDFCASGLRMGCLWSQNQQLLSAFNNLGYFCCTSHNTQWQMAQLLQDRAFVASFLEENRRRLGRSYGMLTSALTKAGIPFTPAVAAMFVWVDLRHLLAEPTFDAEWALWNTMVDDFKLLLTPGVTCHATEPGFFRMCYAWCPAEALPVAVARLQVLQGSKKAQQ